MRYQLLAVAAFAVSSLTAGALQAQPARGAARGPAAQEHRAELREKLKNMTPEERKAALEKAKENRKDRVENMTDEQKAWAKAYQAELKATREGVKAGTLTKATAAQQLKAWRDAHPHPKKS